MPPIRSFAAVTLAALLAAAAAAPTARRRPRPPRRRSTGPARRTARSTSTGATRRATASCRCACTCQTAPTPARPVPLVVFSHGIGGSRMGYSYLGRYWASQGYASLHLQHVGSDRNLWMGNPFALVSAAARRGAGPARPSPACRTCASRSTSCSPGRWPGASTPRRIVAAGHSYGANTTLLAAGAQVERQGRTLDFRDPRIKAAIILSAPPFYGETDPAKILANVTVPTLHVTATDDIIRIPGYYSGADDRVAVFDATGSPRKALAVFAGGSHSMFTDRSGTGGVALNPQVKEATRALSLAFLKRRVRRRGRRAAPMAVAVRRHRRALHAIRAVSSRG